MCLSLLVLASGCPRPRAPVVRPEEALVEATSPLPLADDGDVAGLRVAVGESLAWLGAQPAARVLVFGPRTVTAGALKAALQRLSERLSESPSSEALEALVRADFDVVEAAGGQDGTVLFTGYYEPAIEASLAPDPGYATPIYARPEDLVEVPLEPFAERFKGEVADRLKGEKLFGRLEAGRVVPYWSRAEIVGGKLARKGMELGWAKDPVALFFLQVQGSGVLRLPDGSERRIGYAAANGRQYRSIGAKLIEQGAITKDAMSMQALRAWLAAHPAERDTLLDFNESYVFFHFLEGGALGCLGRPVTPGRSIATDSRLFPPGALAFIRTERPTVGADGQPGWKPLSRFVLNQDTGGAIRGAGRVDVFWGRGPDAELAAGLMKQKGRLVFLVPKR